MFEHIVGYLAIVLLVAVLGLIFWIRIKIDRNRIDKYFQHELDQAHQYCDKMNYNIANNFKTEKENKL